MIRTRARLRAPQAVAVAVSALISMPSAQGGVPNRPPESLEELLRWYPSRDTNATARELESLAAELGINLSIRTGGVPIGRIVSSPPPTTQTPQDQAASDAYQRVRSGLEKYLLDEEQAIGRPVAAPPAEVLAWLTSHATHLAAIRRRLSHGEPPFWARQLETLDEGPMPNLLGQIGLQKVLVVDALARHVAGDIATAVENLEASWVLNTSLRSEPSTIEQLIAISIARMQLGALRRMDRPFPVWRGRLDTVDHRGSMLAAMRVEGWNWMHARHPFPVRPDPHAIGGLQKLWTDWILEPMYRRMMSDAGAAWLLAVERVSSIPPCEIDPERAQGELNDALSIWNRSWIVDGFGGTLSRVARIEVDNELTWKILDIRAARDRAGQWPEGLPDLTVSAACPSRHWLYSITKDQASLTLDPPVQWPKGQLGIILPTRWESGPEPDIDSRLPGARPVHPRVSPVSAR